MVTNNVIATQLRTVNKKMVTIHSHSHIWDGREKPSLPAQRDTLKISTNLLVLLLPNEPEISGELPVLATKFQGLIPVRNFTLVLFTNVIPSVAGQGSTTI